MPTKTGSKKIKVVSLFVGYIADGKLDNHLEMIMQACNDRRRAVHNRRAMVNMAELGEIGTKVRIAANIRPKYLLGYEGVVVEKPDGFGDSSKPLIYVDLGEIVGTGRRRFGPVVGCPAGSLEAVDAD